MYIYIKIKVPVSTNSHLLTILLSQNQVFPLYGLSLYPGWFRIVLFVFHVFFFLSQVSVFPLWAFSSQVSIDLIPDAVGEREDFVFSSVFCVATRSLNQPASSVCQSIVEVKTWLFKEDQK